MIKTRLFKHTFILLFFISAMYLIGIVLHLNWTYWWYDVILHFLSGVSVGMATIIVWHYGFNFSKSDKIQMIKIAVFAALVIGILWEIFELYMGLTFISDGINYVRDTASDIIMDISGGFFGALYAYKLTVKSS